MRSLPLRLFILSVVVAVVGTAVRLRWWPRGECKEEGSIRTYCGFENPEDPVRAPEHEALVVPRMRRNGSGGSLVAWFRGAVAPPSLWPDGNAPGVSAGPAAGDPARPPPSPSQFSPDELFLGPGGSTS